MSKYMHTINGFPATFDGYQICFSTFYGPANKLCNSLAQVRKEQRATKRNRRRDGFDFNKSEYGHLRYD